jgi:hypothetical protein
LERAQADGDGAAEHHRQVERLSHYGRPAMHQFAILSEGRFPPSSALCDEKAAAEPNQASVAATDDCRLTTAD